MERIEVTWRDATGNGGWRAQEEAKEMVPDIITSVGYLLVKNEVAIILVQSLNRESEQVDNPLVIPVENIMSIDYETFSEQN